MKRKCVVDIALHHQVSVYEKDIIQTLLSHRHNGEMINQ